MQRRRNRGAALRPRSLRNRHARCRRRAWNLRGRSDTRCFRRRRSPRNPHTAHTRHRRRGHNGVYRLLCPAFRARRRARGNHLPATCASHVFQFNGRWSKTHMRLLCSCDAHGRVFRIRSSPHPANRSARFGNADRTRIPYLQSLTSHIRCIKHRFSLRNGVSAGSKVISHSVSE